MEEGGRERSIIPSKKAISRLCFWWYLEIEPLVWPADITIIPHAPRTSSLIGVNDFPGCAVIKAQGRLTAPTAVGCQRAFATAGSIGN